MTMKNTEKKKSESGTVAKVAVRIDTIRAIVQIGGAFEVLGVPSDPPYRAAMDQPEWTVVERSATSLTIQGDFSFRGERQVKKNDTVAYEAFFGVSPR